MTDPGPMNKFRQWYLEAASSEVPDPTIMTLATADVDAKPSARIVLLKDFDDRGFVFYTNYGSHKARQIDNNPFAALVIHWPFLGHQVRIEGRVDKTSAKESDLYFKGRPRGSQLGAWASDQSQVISSRESLLESVRKREAEFAGGKIPRPSHWGGYRLIPNRIEFWTEREDRLHERIVYEKQGERWISHLLAP